MRRGEQWLAELPTGWSAGYRSGSRVLRARRGWPDRSARRTSVPEYGARPIRRISSLTSTSSLLPEPQRRMPPADVGAGLAPSVGRIGVMPGAGLATNAPAVTARPAPRTHPPRRLRADQVRRFRRSGPHGASRWYEPTSEVAHQPRTALEKRQHRRGGEHHQDQRAEPLLGEPVVKWSQTRPSASHAGKPGTATATTERSIWTAESEQRNETSPPAQNTAVGRRPNCACPGRGLQRRHHRRTADSEVFQGPPTPARRPGPPTPGPGGPPTRRPAARPQNHHADADADPPLGTATSTNSPIGMPTRSRRPTGARSVGPPPRGGAARRPARQHPHQREHHGIAWGRRRNQRYRGESEAEPDER